MDTSDEEEIQAESQQTPEQTAAGLGAKKKEQERLRRLVAQKQQTIKFASVNDKQSTKPGEVPISRRKVWPGIVNGAVG